MKISFKQYGQNLVAILDGEKFTSTIAEKEERNTKVSSIKSLIEKFNTSKSEKVKDKVFNQVKKLMSSEEFLKNKGVDENKTQKKVLKNKIKKSKDQVKSLGKSLDTILKDVEHLSDEDKLILSKKLSNFKGEPVKKADVTPTPRRGEY